jgi:hypothetical protein
MIMLSSSLKMVYFIVMVFCCMFLMALRDFKFFKLGMMFWLHAILDSTKPLS